MPYSPIVPINYDEIRDQFVKQKHILEQRLEEIAAQRLILDATQGDIQREIIGIDQALEGLDFVKDEPTDLTEPLGFTEQIKRIIQQSSTPLLPTQIRDALLTTGYKRSSLKNMLISVHTVIDRLGPLLEEVKIENRKAYKWKQPEIAGLIEPIAPRTRRRLFGQPPTSNPDNTQKLMDDARKKMWGLADDQPKK